MSNDAASPNAQTLRRPITEKDFTMPTTSQRRWLTAALAGLVLLLLPAAATADTSVVGWGTQQAIGLGKETVSTVSPTTLPGAQGATAAALNQTSSYLLTPSGVLVAGWGSDLGLAGVSPGVLDPLPYTLIPGTAGAKAIATAGSTLIVEADGSVDGFGVNWSGEAGGTPGSAIETPTPVEGLTNVTAVAASESNSIALKGDGTVWSWGRHDYLGSAAGAAGPNTGIPTQVTLPAGTPATAISAGGAHFLVLLQDGSVWAWGANEYGMVGNGSTDAVTVPVQVIPPAASGDPKVTAVSAGNQSSFALYSDGTYKAWGLGYFGELGLGGTTDEVNAVTVPTSPYPAAVAAHPSAYPPLKQIVSTFSTTYAIVAGSGRVLVWGDNSTYPGGQFGFGESTPFYPYAWPYDPTNPGTPGTSGQGVAEIPQPLGRLKDVPWLGVGPVAQDEIAATGSVLRVENNGSSAPAFFSHPVGTFSAPQLQVFTSVGEPTTVTSIRITGANAGDFSIDAAGTSSSLLPGTPYSVPLVIPADGALHVLARFHPSAPGERFATLEVSGQGETASIQLSGFGTELPGSTSGAQGDKGQPGSAGLAGPAGPAGPAGKNGVVVFSSTRARVSAKRGGPASLSFLLVNGTSGRLAGATVQASVPRALGTANSSGATGIPALPSGSSRRVKVGLAIGDHAKLGAHRIEVAFKAGSKTVTRTVRVRVTD
ncbi:MAG: hypothetical protein ABW065_05730 [Solirubrobacterales bacterium]